MPSVSTTSFMGEKLAERPASRPDAVHSLVESVDRYNPSNASVLEEYLAAQCADGTYDGLANLALLKLYQFNPHLVKEESMTNALVKALSVPDTPDFSLCLHLLPPHILDSASQEPGHPDATLAESVQKLQSLQSLLENGKFEDFWNVFNGDDLYADLTADCNGFDDAVRRYITVVVGLTAHALASELLSSWLNLHGEHFENWVTERAGWTFTDNGAIVAIPITKENAAVSRVTGEKLQLSELSRIIHRAD